jgi:hypothetical protein
MGYSDYFDSKTGMKWIDYQSYVKERIPFAYVATVRGDLDYYNGTPSKRWFRVYEAADAGRIRKYIGNWTRSEKKAWKSVYTKLKKVEDEVNS